MNDAIVKRLVIRSPQALTASSYAAMFFLGVSGALIGTAARNIGLTASQIGLLVATQNKPGPLRAC